MRIPFCVSSIITCEGLSMLYFRAKSIGIITVADIPLLRKIGAITFRVSERDIVPFDFDLTFNITLLLEHCKLEN
jgi:hypothetical protein